MWKQHINVANGTPFSTTVSGVNNFTFSSQSHLNLNFAGLLKYKIDLNETNVILFLKFADACGVQGCKHLDCHFESLLLCCKSIQHLQFHSSGLTIQIWLSKLDPVAACVLLL